jgi:hypothetical protein
MSFEEWEKTYKPIPNHIDENASFNDGENGYMFETYGDEVAFVKKANPAHIWTYGDGDDGGGYIWSGWHFVNRIGYFITEVPCPENTTIQIQVDEPAEECDTCGVFIYNEEDDHECEEE